MGAFTVLGRNKDNNYKTYCSDLAEMCIEHGF